MNTLTAWEFHDPSGAAQALKRMHALATQGITTLDPDQERRLRAALAD